MRVFWMVLVGLILTLTPLAYVTGELVGPPPMGAPATPATASPRSPARTQHPAAHQRLLTTQAPVATPDLPGPTPAAAVVSRPRPPVTSPPARTPAADPSAAVRDTQPANPVGPSPATPSSTAVTDQPSPSPTGTATAGPSDDESPSAGYPDPGSPGSDPTHPTRTDRWGEGW